MHITFGGECFCIHGISQIVDIFFQCYIFGKGFVSEPVTKILYDGNEREYPQFLRLYLKFLSQKTLALPEEVIKIPIRCCPAHPGTEGKCDDGNCGPLSDKQQRYLYKEIVSHFDTLCSGNIRKFFKIFVYFVSGGELKTYSDDIEESDELGCLGKDNTCKVTEFLFENSCNGQVDECDLKENLFYYRWQEYFSFDG